ncbi:MAG: 30S ribosomal protein S20 [Phycisphaerales bacterium]|nr:30S ribosomal protein S20 [Phycisphaerales bacterium]|tara:strand:+ start:3646 stop:3906 length:261 start_codon:yes stop_codon:yes gene_type:complete
MAHSNSAKKRIRQNMKRRALNRWRMRNMRVAIKAFDDSLSNGGDAVAAYRKAASTVDRTAQKGVIHRNQAARRKSRMNKRLKAHAG